MGKLKMSKGFLFLLFVVLLITVPLLAACAGPQGTSITGPQGLTGLQGDTGLQGATGLQGSQGPQGPAGLVVEVNTLKAAKTTVTPWIDATVDAVWSRATPLLIEVNNGENLPDSSTTVELRALYTDTDIYFLAQWADETLSYQRSPWQKQADGSWVKLSDPADLGGDNNLYYEDKAAFIWNINNSIAGFSQMGCLVTCHPGETKPYGNKYTSAAGEIGDIWHWKSVRTGPVGQIDDQYVDSTIYNATTAPEAGRKSDPKTGGGYSNNNLVGGVPQYALPGDMPAQWLGQYWVYDSEKVALNDTLYTAGDEVPSIIISSFTGDRGDISSADMWDGKWTLEWTRKLNTGSQYDVQFTDTNAEYYFGMAIFDNAQVRHAWSPGAYKLMFASAVTGTPAGPPMTPATSGMSTATTCKACHGASGPGPTMPSLPDHSSFADTRTVCTTCHTQAQ